MRIKISDFSAAPLRKSVDNKRGGHCQSRNKKNIFQLCRLPHCERMSTNVEGTVKPKKKTQISKFLAAPLRHSVDKRRGGHCQRPARKGSLRRCVLILKVGVITFNSGAVIIPSKKWCSLKGGTPGAEPKIYYISASDTYLNHKPY